jgi:TonB family protein
MSGEGLSGVAVAAKGLSAGVRTAADGSFTLAVPATARALVFALAGYETTEQPLPTDSSALTLTLAPTSAAASNRAEEPVLVRRERAPAPVALAAMPAGGERAFRNYLRDSLEYPEKALRERKEGSVRLSFVVNVDGTLQDIKVVRGLSEECDAEAIRLLKEGPAWHAAVVNGRRTARTVQITVPFRLIDVK